MVGGYSWYDPVAGSMAVMAIGPRPFFLLYDLKPARRRENV